MSPDSMLAIHSHPTYCVAWHYLVQSLTSASDCQEIECRSVVARAFLKSHPTALPLPTQVPKELINLLLSPLQQLEIISLEATVRQFLGEGLAPSTHKEYKQAGTTT